MKKISFLLILFMVIVSFSFPQNEYSLQIIIVEPPFTGGNTVTLDPPGGVYSGPTLVTLTAVAIDSHYFLQWAGDLTGSENPATIMVDGPKSVEAWFNAGQATPVPPGTAPCNDKPGWYPDVIYETAGIQVVYNGKLYESNRYTVDENPEENSGENEAWTLLGNCGPGLTIAPTGVPTAAPTDPPGGATGDVNGDNSIDIVDALLVAQYYVGLNPSGFNVAAADSNCDGGVDIVDALIIAQYYVGLINGFC